MKEFAAATAEHLIELSKEHEFPLTRPNWKGLMDEITRQLTPHHLVAEELARIEAAKKMGVDLVAMEERIAAWRKQNDLVTAQEIAERHGLLLDEVIKGQSLGFLNFVPIPDEVIQVPNRYRLKYEPERPGKKISSVIKQIFLPKSYNNTLFFARLVQTQTIDSSVSE